ncbi:WD40 repeat domain-containing protein [Kitasatospora sp. CB01950]|uniref:WD40 repeat domain-containing protein n=1 Tax=Kitasatospora sp. CB01950 TaxID=1703930 RepID=UPI000940227A|nr:WD40 repeat domain-containing protein [Kitasatospora sp. CB01950]OKJ13639.1 hypothetical protein AMK19_09325 [Kitasatospora sp. CB01950]
MTEKRAQARPRAARPALESLLSGPAGPQAAVRQALLGDPPLWWSCCSEAVRSDPGWLYGPRCAELRDWLNATAPDPGAASVGSVDHPLLLARTLAAPADRIAEHDPALLELTADWDRSGLLCADSAPVPAYPSGSGLNALTPRLAGTLSAALERIGQLRAAAGPGRPSPAAESLVAIAALMLAGVEPRGRRAVRVAVVFARSAGADGPTAGPEGVTGVLELREFPAGPPGLYPDPRTMVGVRSPNGDFATALGHAWRLAGERRERRCVLWRIVLSDGQAAPARLEGPSLGLAFALGLRELLRRSPTGRPGPTGLRGFARGLRPRTAVTGALDGTEYLVRIGDLDAKLLAARRDGLRLVVPEANRLDVAKAPEPGDVRFARTLRQADRYARRYRTGRLAVALALVAVSATGAGAALQEHRDTVRERARAMSRGLAAQAALLDQPQPNIAKQERIAAFRTAPTPEAFDALASGFRVPGTIAVPGVLHVAVTDILIAVVADGRAELWSRSEHRFTATLPTVGVTAMTFRPDGDALAVGTSAGGLEVWDVADPGHPVRTRTLPGAAQPIEATAFSPDGRLLAAGGDDHTVRLWDPEPNGATTPLAAFDGGTSTVTGLAVSPDGRQLAGSNADGSTGLWDITHPAAPTLAAGIPGSEQMRAVAFAPSGHLLAATGIDQKVHLWGTRDPAHPETIATVDVPDRMAGVAFSPDGHFLAASSLRGLTPIRLWDLTDPQQPFALPTPLDGSASTEVAFSPDGSTLVALDKSAIGNSRALEDKVKLWSAADLRRPAALATLPDLPDADSVALSPDGSTMATAGVDDVRLWDVGDRERPHVVWERKGDGEVYRVALAGRTLAIGGEKAVTLLDVTDPKHPVEAGSVGLSGVGAFPEAIEVAFSPDGRTIVARAGDRALVQLIDASNISRPELLATLRGDGALGGHATLSADGALLAVGNLPDNQSATLLGPAKPGLWDVRDPADPKPLTGIADRIGIVTAVQFAPKGSVLAAGGPDGSVAFWRIAPDGRATRLASLPGGGAELLTLNYSADGAFLIGLDTVGAARMWDVRDPGNPTPLGHYDQPDQAGLAYGNAFAAVGPDRGPGVGRLIVTAADLGETYLWTSDPEAVVARLCRTIGDTATTQEWNQYVPGVAHTDLCRNKG